MDVPVAPGANVVDGLKALIALNPDNGSVTTTLVNVTSPVLVTVKVYVITSPTAPVPPTEEVFTRAIDGVCVNGVVVGSSWKLLLSSDKSVTGPPIGGVPVAVAWLVTEPASRSDWVMV